MKEVVYSVNILIGLGLLGVAWALYHILTLDNNEKQDTTNSHTNKTHHE
jgi:mannose/fructose/N-acetylgalactosamine-specific phosphotransferase system component IIC